MRRFDAPSMLAEAELDADTLLESAVSSCARQLHLDEQDVCRQLREGSCPTHSLLRYAVAKRVADYLGQLDGGIRGVYLYGSAMDDTARSCSDIDLVVLVERKLDQARSLLQQLDLALLTSYRALIGTAPHPRSLLDVHLVDLEEERTRRSYGAVIHSLQTRPLCLWRRSDGQR